MIDIISDSENSNYFVREDGIDVAVFSTLAEAQEYSSSLT
jgi:hypothetical protein